MSVFPPLPRSYLGSQHISRGARPAEGRSRLRAACGLPSAAGGGTITGDIPGGGTVAMLTIRPAAERGHTRLDWLDSRHTFSFRDYLDSRHMRFGTLRVINDDRVEPGRGFGTHGHRDMEILTWILEGELEHRDSLGTGSVIRPGEVQIMSAGTGIEHSEFNPSPVEPVHLLQIW